VLRINNCLQAIFDRVSSLPFLVDVDTILLKTVVFEAFRWTLDKDIVSKLYSKSLLQTYLKMIETRRPVDNVAHTPAS
jgi:hypothetical protein